MQGEKGSLLELQRYHRTSAWSPPPSSGTPPTTPPTFTPSPSTSARARSELFARSRSSSPASSLTEEDEDSGDSDATPTPSVSSAQQTALRAFQQRLLAASAAGNGPVSGAGGNAVMGVTSGGLAIGGYFGGGGASRGLPARARKGRRHTLADLR